jgi:hypothetical protein
MSGPRRITSLARFVFAGTLAAALLAGAATSPHATVSAASRWTGGIDLYRPGVFTTQKTWLWCTAADIQIIRNIVFRTTDHTRASQQRYFDYMRAHDRYPIPVSDGVDAAGWAAGLRHFVDGRYRLYESRSFDSALRSAVTNLRRTNLPVAITVDHGNHAWIITGFTATADPAATTRFTVTGVNVVGPLWGLQSRSYGYDMVPDRKLTVSQLRGFFTPWHYARIRMAWEGDWVSVQPAAPATTAAAPAPTKALAATTRLKATPGPTPRPTPKPTPAPTPMATATPDPSPTDEATPPTTASPTIASPAPTFAAIAEVAGPGPSDPPDPSIEDSSSVVPMAVGVIVLVAAALVSFGALAFRRRPPA